MRLVIEGDADVVASFLLVHEYPYLWSATALKDYAIKARIEDDDGDTAGFVWAIWHPDIPKALDFHACIAKDCRGRWLSRELLDDLVKLAQFLGAEILITHTPDAFKAGLVGQLLTRRLGFSKAPDGSYYKVIVNGIRRRRPSDQARPSSRASEAEG